MFLYAKEGGAAVDISSGGKWICAAPPPNFQHPRLNTKLPQPSHGSISKLVMQPPATVTERSYPVKTNDHTRSSQSHFGAGGIWQDATLFHKERPTKLAAES